MHHSAYQGSCWMIVFWVFMGLSFSRDWLLRVEENVPSG